MDYSLTPLARSPRSLAHLDLELSEGERTEYVNIRFDDKMKRKTKKIKKICHKMQRETKKSKKIYSKMTSKLFGIERKNLASASSVLKSSLSSSWDLDLMSSSCVSEPESSLLLRHAIEKVSYEAWLNFSQKNRNLWHTVARSLARSLNSLAHLNPGLSE